MNSRLDVCPERWLTIDEVGEWTINEFSVGPAEEFGYGATTKPDFGVG